MPGVSPREGLIQTGGQGFGEAEDAPCGSRARGTRGTLFLWLTGPWSRPRPPAGLAWSHPVRRSQGMGACPEPGSTAPISGRLSVLPLNVHQ